jgi:hypothetical protein
MKMQMEPTKEPNAADSLKASRFQIFRQTRAGNYVAGGQSDSASEAIEIFLSATPMFEEGGSRIWDRRQERLSRRWWGELGNRHRLRSAPPHKCLP